jgi:hypothetical protein
MSGKDTDQYSDEETQRRVEATLRAAFNTPRPKKASAQAKKLARKPKEKAR